MPKSFGDALFSGDINAPQGRVVDAETNEPLESHGFLPVQGSFRQPERIEDFQGKERFVQAQYLGALKEVSTAQEQLVRPDDVASTLKAAQRIEQLQAEIAEILAHNG